jgi:enoyl-[acyl-carrier protein] reductase II
MNNAFAQSIFDAERRDVPLEEYEALFKKSSLKQAALDGDVEWGKVEAGQSAGLIERVDSAADVMRALVRELDEASRRMAAMSDPTASSVGATA